MLKSIWSSRRSWLFPVVLFSACQQPEHPGKALSEQYCGSCHLVPDPGHLDKRTWYNSVLPHMRFRMGYPDAGIRAQIPPADRDAVIEFLPDTPMVSESDWNAIFDYYIKAAPDSLPITSRIPRDSLALFQIIPVRSLPANVTHVKYDSFQKSILVGTASGDLFTLNAALQVIDSVKLPSAVSCVEVSEGSLLVSCMGIMFPNDQRAGSIVRIDQEGQTNVVDSLRRPVFVASGDFDGNQTSDLVICNFGNYMGSLEVNSVGQANNVTRHVLSELPGARKAVIRDFNGDARPDILALLTQGDERIVLYENNGGFNFSEKILFRLPAVYGSSYFEVHDFNDDGHFDILYSNGDNGDISRIQKPYHGIRVFENDGKGMFREAFFHPMPGASQVMAFDFDGDGDKDLAAISYFPEKKKWETGFAFLENLGNYKFRRFETPLARQGRWVTMELADVDSDNDMDILLGALSARGLGAGDDIAAEWRNNGCALLVLINRSGDRQ